VRDTAEKRRFMARCIAAPGGFKFQRRRALIGQQLGAEGAGKTLGQFHDLHVI
jgi:hypothetical protein